MEGWTLTPQQWRKAGIVVALDGIRSNAAAVLSRPGVDLNTLLDNEQLDEVVPDELRGLGTVDQEGVAATVLTECKYRRYLERQEREIAMLVREEAITLPAGLWPCASAPWAQALKLEVQEKLDAARPVTLAAAGRVQGVTPAALVILRLQARLANSQIRLQAKYQNRTA